MNNACFVFYAGLLYGQYDKVPALFSLPDGAYIYMPYDRYQKHWYLKDMTPVLIEDVPKELRVLLLLLT